MSDIHKVLHMLSCYLQEYSKKSKTMQHVTMFTHVRLSFATIHEQQSPSNRTTPTPTPSSTRTNYSLLQIASYTALHVPTSILPASPAWGDKRGAARDAASACTRGTLYSTPRKVDVHERLMNDEAEIVGIAMQGG
jgi:hypothetical protein